MRFERLVVIGRADGKRSSKWHCRCDCGNEVDVYKDNLLRGRTKSCGCYHKDEAKQRHTTHGKSGTKLHGVWWGMIQRCYYDKHIDYRWYSSRGITVCDEWRKNFQAFYDWAIQNGYGDGLSIDRIDNDLGYSPDNCRFISAKEQAQNRHTNLNYTYNGETKCLKQWAEAFGIKYGTLYCRIKRGIAFEEAIKI